MFFVGTFSYLSCTTDLHVTSIEWWLNNELVSSTTSSTDDELVLTFDPVPDSIHGNIYLCRVTSPYGVQEQSYEVMASSKLTSCTVFNVHST